METGGKWAMAFAIYSLVLVGFAAFGSAAVVDDAGAIAPSPVMHSGGYIVGAPAAMAAVFISLVAVFV
ncbi:hypothetical protein ACLOJK_008445 [Asimina triloba]